VAKARRGDRRVRGGGAASSSMLLLLSSAPGRISVIFPNSEHSKHRPSLFGDGLTGGAPGVPSTPCSLSRPMAARRVRGRCRSRATRGITREWKLRWGGEARAQAPASDPRPTPVRHAGNRARRGYTSSTVGVDRPYSPVLGSLRVFEPSCGPLPPTGPTLHRPARHRPCHFRLRLVLPSCSSNKTTLSLCLGTVLKKHYVWLKI
jgi:hypothetical protein